MTEKMIAMNEKLAVLEAKRKANQYTTDAEDECRQSIKEVNSELIDARINELLSVVEKSGVSVMLNTFIDDQFIDGFKLSQDKETGEFSIEPAKHLVKFSQIDKASKTELAVKGNWMKFLTIFDDNMIRNVTLEKGESEAFAKFSLVPELIELRDKKGWKAVSMTALQGQLQELVNMILPKEIAPHIIKADVKYMKMSLVSTKSERDNKAGSIAVRKDAKMEEFLWRMLYTRKNSLAYQFQNEHKDKGQGKNGLGADNGKAAEGGDVSVADKTPAVSAVAKAEEHVA